MLRAGPNSLPRPARSALNQEVRQGSCEWLRHSWDAGSESSLVTFFSFAVCGDADNKSSGQSQRNTIPTGWCFFCIYRPGRGSNRARAKREKHAGGMFWCPRACGGPAGPPASLVARSKKKHHPEGWCFFAFAGPPAMCSPSCRQDKSVVFLRRFCLARKTAQRERYFIICYTFSFSLQPLCQWLHRR